MSKNTLTVIDHENNTSVTINFADVRMIWQDKLSIRIVFDPHPSSNGAHIVMHFSDMTIAANCHNDIITNFAYPCVDEHVRTVIKVSSFKVGSRCYP